MKTLRFSKLLPLAFLAVSGTMMAHATQVNTGGADGTYTYTFSNMPNGASFTATTTGGPIGGPNSNISAFSYNGTPDPLYAPEGSVTGTGNFTYTVSGDPGPVADGGSNNGGFDVEIMLQYNFNDSYATRLDFYFTEPNSFWTALGTDLSFTSGDAGPYIYGTTGMTAPCDDNGCYITFGEVSEGATFAYTSPGTTDDPPCTSCTISISFVPATTPSPVPEPSSLALLSTGVAAAFGVYRRRRGSL